MSEYAINIEDISKKFRIYHERNQTLKTAVMRRRISVHDDFWALKDISFEIPSGSTFALVGNNGSGKSTLLKCIAQILYPTKGSIKTSGRLAALLEVGSGFHPELTGRENVYLNGSILGMKKAEIDRKFDEIVDFSGVEEFIDQPVKNYSSGMYVRLGFSVAITVEPEILVVDEVLAVGDAAFQEKCTAKFAQIRHEGRTVVVVAHSIAALRNMSDHAAWLEHGEVKAVGPASSVLAQYFDSTRTDLGRDAQGRIRYGSGEARLEAVEVVGYGETSDLMQVVAGAPIEFRIHYTASERIDNPVFALTIETVDGILLWDTNTRDSDFPIPAIDGGGVLNFMIPSLPLTSGEFVVHAAVSDQSTQHVFDHVRGAVRLLVERGSYGVERSGYLALGGRWNTTDTI
ncbi:MULTISPECIES: ABC transporter ATP-binding protein [Rhodococcus]|jgi:ABC-2 type transport system ATP-binding protein|uniref:ABC transporter ATP-binding protein n=1 Tax=Rhodococcus qingshengii JCM 15477 TaxID=1303681 RepID=A0AB38RP17_RHOSG|nr:MULTISPECIES: ABC transporter ATP-binding protein [Rhodococcus]MCC4306111.1 ABC transporter ATP-binding protein [Rhodococcus sp. 3-2]UPU46962.1 ABC transporter ATP-binding protein [Rhodococcus qingshengii JCM 15477]